MTKKKDTMKYWQISTVVLAILLIASIATGGFELADKEDDNGPAGTGTVKIIEFSDFECPFCARGAAVVDQVKAAYGDQVEVEFKHFPLSFHKNAQKAAEASECARDQDKFWEMHDVIFANQQALAVDDLKGYAETIGLDTATFNTCLDSGEKAEKVLADFNEGRAKGVTGTPAFFVGTEKIVGAQPFEVFKAAIDKQLA